MAEILGAVTSALNLAGLFKSCIEAFEIIETANDADTDIRKLALRLRIEKYRLYTWGESVGLTVNPATGRSSPIEGFEFKLLVQDALQTIIGVFHDAEKLEARYGCAKTTSDRSSRKRKAATDQSAAEDLAQAFGNFSSTSSVPALARSRSLLPPCRLIAKARWAIRNKKKFESLIGDIKDFIDGVISITKTISKAARQEAMVRCRMQNITNSDTLTSLATACETDYRRQRLSDWRP